MAIAVQRRKGTTAEHQNFIGENAEITIDTTKCTVVVHDGTTVGGHALAKEAQVTADIASGVAESKSYTDAEISTTTSQLEEAIGDVENLANSVGDTVTSIIPRVDDIAPITPKVCGVSHYFKDDTALAVITQSFVQALGADHATHIVLCPLLVNDDATGANNLHYEYTIPALTAAIATIAAEGLGVILKFHLVKNSDGHSLEEPTDQDALIADLRECILDTLDASQSIEIVCVANESPTICAGNRAAWESLFAAIRAQNPGIKITNSALFSEIKNATCVFWDLCDYIGCNAYPSCVDYNTVGTYDDALRAMYYTYRNDETYVTSMYKIARRYDKSYLITEMGIRPYAWQMASPSVWTALGTSNETVQADYYRAALETFLHAGSCAGMFVWNATDGFTFVGKAAESVLSAAFEEVQE